MEAALRKYFKLKSFWLGQLDALLPLVHGRDVFVRMATKTGKSFCLFLAPLVIGVVISPLNALMDQQVQRINKYTATELNKYTLY